MKFCQPHWDRLKAEIQSHGVADFIAHDGEEAIARVVGQINGERQTRENYDPLMSAHWMIVSRAIDCGGLYLLTGDHCPLCELKTHSSVPNIDEDLVKGASKSAVDYIAQLPAS
jgi:hypothetical protein